MMPTYEEVMETYKSQLTADYYGDYLNESNLTKPFNYEKVTVNIQPSKNPGDKKFQLNPFSGNVRFTGNPRNTFNLHFIPLKVVGNFGGQRIAKDRKLLPFIDEQKFVSSGHNHPFYAKIENILVEELCRNPKFDCWVSLLQNYQNDFKPEQFGLAIMCVLDSQFKIIIKHNDFDWNTNLIYNADYNNFKAMTVDKNICIRR
jgi:hypothetical protein